jgi:eukaryotic translation initiation factor 2C
MVEFATKKPDQRLSAIKTGIQVLAYGQSRYVRDFGLDIKTGSLPMENPARIINPPELKYGQGSKQATVRPVGGAWNLVDKKFTKPMSLGSWIVVIFVPPNRFGSNEAKETINGLVKGCEAVGMQVPEKQPLFVHKNPQDIADKSIFDAVAQNRAERKTIPTFIVCILPDGSNADLYTAVKQ